MFKFNKIVLFVQFLFSSILFGQIGINTKSPLGIVHIDGGKDNEVTSPSLSQILNDVVVSSEGNLGIGTSTPTSKVHVFSGLSNTSGLNLKQLNLDTPISMNQNVVGLGIDALGNVVTTEKPFYATVNTRLINSSNTFLINSSQPYFLLDTTASVPAKIPLDGNTGTIIDSFVLDVPTGGKGVMINFMLGLDAYGYQSGTCSLLVSPTVPASCSNRPSVIDIIRAELYVDNVASGVFQHVRMNKGTAGSSDSNLQFNFSTLINLAGGNRILDVRLSKINPNVDYSNGTLRFQTLSASLNATYIK